MLEGLKTPIRKAKNFKLRCGAKNWRKFAQNALFFDKDGEQTYRRKNGKNCANIGGKINGTTRIRRRFKMYSFTFYNTYIY